MEIDINKNIRELIVIEKEFLNTINEKKPVFLALSESEKFELSVNIVEKVISIQESISEEKNSLLNIYSSLRYILETLIQTELLLKEPAYTYKLFYSIYNHQVDKGEKFVARIKSEIQVMEKFEIRDRQNAQIIADGIKNKEDIEVTREKHQEATLRLDNEADSEFTMFCGNFKWFGYGYSQSFLEDKVLPEYEKRLKHFKKTQIEKAKQIVRQERISNLFDFKKQHSRVFKELKDERSWKTKATIAGLQAEYALVYDLTSAILHSTSYSYTTSNETSKQEVNMILDLSNKYSKKNHE